MVGVAPKRNYFFEKIFSYPAKLCKDENASVTAAKAFLKKIFWGLSFRGLSFRSLSFRDLSFRSLSFRDLSFEVLVLDLRS